MIHFAVVPVDMDNTLELLPTVLYTVHSGSAGYLIQPVACCHYTLELLQECIDFTLELLPEGNKYTLEPFPKNITYLRAVASVY